MSEPVKTLDGWYCLHDFRRINWTAWKEATEEERRKALQELNRFLDNWTTAHENRTGSHALYAIIGQKADLLFMLLRPTLEELNEIENAFNKSALAPFTEPAYSYVSVVELSNYLAPKNGDNDPENNAYLQSRLKPKLPATSYICFYPMDKRRQGEDNWYMLPMEERQQMVRSHGLIGRRYAGKVKQIITGSIGFDDWEWGVTLFSDDALQFKKLVYEMRFDEVSARFGEFGPFYVGRLLEKDALDRFFAV